MTELTSFDLTEQENKDRNELFRYTDLTHPVMQTLFEFKLQLDDAPSEESD